MDQTTGTLSTNTRSSCTTRSRHSSIILEVQETFPKLGCITFAISKPMPPPSSFRILQHTCPFGFLSQFSSNVLIHPNAAAMFLKSRIPPNMLFPRASSRYRSRAFPRGRLVSNRPPPHNKPLSSPPPISPHTHHSSPSTLTVRPLPPPSLPAQPRSSLIPPNSAHSALIRSA
jgi:hypothetical protein